MSQPATDWSLNWAWGLPLIMLTVLAHVFGLLLIRERTMFRLSSEQIGGRRRFHRLFALALGPLILLITGLHAFETAAWAAAYVALGALPDVHDAMLDSLNAMTTYGHERYELASHWQMMGALEALTGMILFGLTTAFLFSVIQTVWPTGRSGHRRS